jgi:hypothetical protein
VAPLSACCCGTKLESGSPTNLSLWRQVVAPLSAYRYVCGTILESGSLLTSVFGARLWRLYLPTGTSVGLYLRVAHLLTSVSGAMLWRLYLHTADCTPPAVTLCPQYHCGTSCWLEGRRVPDTVQVSVSDPDPHSGGRLDPDPDPHSGGRLDPDPDQRG